MSFMGEANFGENKENVAQKVQALVKQFDQITDQCVRFSQSASSAGGFEQSNFQRGGLRSTYDAERRKSLNIHRRSLNAANFQALNPDLDHVAQLGAQLRNAERDLEIRADLADSHAVFVLYKRISNRCEDLQEGKKMLLNAERAAQNHSVFEKRAQNCRRELDEKLISLQCRRNELQNLLDALRAFENHRAPMKEWLQKIQPTAEMVEISKDSSALDQLTAEYNRHYDDYMNLKKVTENLFKEFQFDDLKNLKSQWNEITEQWNGLTEIIIRTRKMQSPDIKTKQALCQCETWFKRQLTKLEFWNQNGFTVAEQKRIDDILEKSARLIATFRQNGDGIMASDSGRKSLETLEIQFDRISHLVRELRLKSPQSSPSAKCSASPTTSQTMSTRSTTICSSPQSETSSVNGAFVRVQFEPECLRDLLDCLRNYNRIKFSNYRTAMKVWAVQKRLNFDLIDLAHVDLLFRQLLLKNHGDLSIDEQFQILKPLFEKAHADFPTSIKDVRDAILKATELFKSLAMSNEARTIKMALSFLVNGNLDQKYRYIFGIYTENGEGTKEKMVEMFTDLAKFPRLVGEDSSRFGLKSAPCSTASLFKHVADSNGQLKVEHVTVDQFLEWTHLNPETLTWARSLHHLIRSEFSKHKNAKCAGCKMYPIVGLRFKCLHCFNVDMCQNCFFARKTIKGHKPEHELQEYYEKVGDCTVRREFLLGLGMLKSAYDRVRRQPTRSQILTTPTQRLGQTEDLSQAVACMLNLATEHSRI
uniref:ZZ-type domain-containing protein n=1 Tax=Bursaphelenchus xylophilus TaxID=6326 RepID=A0A1I7SB28_BURXY